MDLDDFDDNKDLYEDVPIGEKNSGAADDSATRLHL